MKTRNTFMARANRARIDNAAQKIAAQEKAEIRSARAALEAADRQKSAEAAEEAATRKKVEDLQASRRRFLAEAANPSSAMWLCHEMEALRAENVALRAEVAALSKPRAK